MSDLLDSVKPSENIIKHCLQGASAILNVYFCILLAQGTTGYLANGHMSKHMLIGGINALPYSSHIPTVHI